MSSNSLRGCRVPGLGEPGLKKDARERGLLLQTATFFCSVNSKNRARKINTLTFLFTMAAPSRQEVVLGRGLKTCVNLWIEYWVAYASIQLLIRNVELTVVFNA